MIIICPSCMARYRLEGESATLSPAGRSMRCGRCGNTWQATPVEAPPEILPPALYHGEAQVREDEGLPEPPAGAPPPLQAQRIEGDWEEADAGEAETDEDGGRPHSVEERPWRAHRRARRAAAARARPRARQAGPRWQAFVLGMLLAVFVVALHNRADVVRAVPASATLFERIGLPVNLRGLEFRNVVARRAFEDGLPVLFIEGEVVNLRRETTEVPALRIAVRGRQGEELYVWRVDPRQQALEAEESLTVRTRLAVPPGGAQDVELRFVERGPAGLGMR